ncbi:hypothetical protein [Sorangium sp. So ce1024]|uniref:hypothetical protein n=1 Tax=Sorangium sp. So ce1024 TaxID=3133327 RepID=UPI003F113246
MEKRQTTSRDPADEPSAAGVVLSDSVLDMVAEFLTEIAREDRCEADELEHRRRAA